jgi:hypothetical protein
MRPLAWREGEDYACSFIRYHSLIVVKFQSLVVWVKKLHNFHKHKGSTNMYKIKSV